MSYRDWLPEIGIGVGVIIAILLALWAGEQVRRNAILQRIDKQIETYNRRNGNKPPQGLERSILAIYNEADADHYQPDCRKEENVDRCAQLSMAASTKRQANYALYGLILLGFALAAAVWAAWEARKAARAGGVTADLTRDHLHVLERPYVVLEVQEPGIAVDASGAMRFATKRFAYAFANYGRSAAIIKEICVSWPTVELGKMPETINPKTTKGRRAPVGVVSAFEKPCREAKELLSVVDPKLLESDAWQKYRLFCIGFVRYQDFFGTSYVTGFCAQFDPFSASWVLTGGKTGYNYQTQEPKGA